MAAVDKLPFAGAGHDGPPSPTVVTGEFYSAPDDLDLRELGRILWRRRNTIIAIAVLVVAMAVLVIYQLQPRYRAVATVMLDQREAQVVDIQSVLSGLPSGDEAIESEIQIIRSSKLAERAIERLQLHLDPEFNPMLRPPGVLTLATGIHDVVPDPVIEAFNFSSDRLSISVEQREARLMELMIDVFRAKLRINQVDRSRAIGIAFESQNPDTAAKVANTLADLYVVSQLEAKFEATERANSWLNERLGDLRAKVERSEQQIEIYRKERGLIEGENVVLVREQISDLSGKLLVERGKRSEAEARLARVEGLLSSGGVGSATEVLSSGLIQHLQAQEAEVRRKLAELATSLGDKHPQLIATRAELGDLEQKIRNEVSKIVNGLRNEAQIARAREESLQGGLDELKLEVEALQGAQIEMRSLEREAQANRSLLENFLARSKETESQENLQDSDAVVLSPAAVPRKPMYPRKRLFLLVSLIGALVTGVAMAFLMEFLERGFRSVEQTERSLGLPALGLVPLLRERNPFRRPTPETFLRENPNSAYAEAIRSVQTAVLLSEVERPPKTLLVASSLPREGKTALAQALAFNFARSGRSAVLVDCDLRRPSVHRLNGLERSPGLTEYVAGQVTLADIIELHDSGCRIVTAGRGVANPTDIVSSSRMAALLQELSRTFDLVVLDSPPTLAVSDAQILARHADKAVFVVRWASTPQDVASEGLRKLQDVGGDLAGVVMTMVDARKHALYSRRGSAYFSPAVQKYYTRA